ncbi:MAG: hypothetical protein Q8P00_06020 [Dehalococcoidia bacterium]|nr:hypothetical protein [Dehalococcoidia bacterium]
MSITYHRESNTLILSSPKHGTETGVQPLYVQACPLCSGLLRAYFPWAEGPLNVGIYNTGDSWDLHYRGYHCQGYQGLVQNSHFCPQGWAYLAFTPAQSLLSLLRDRLSYRGCLDAEDQAALDRAGTMLLSGQPCPEGLVLSRELVQGQDAFLALRYETVRAREAGPYHVALRQEHLALLALLEPLLPNLTGKIRRELGI